jgi:tape measure domain-containing protein
LGTAAELAGRKMEHAGRRGFLMNQAIFTMRRYLYNATLAATALGAAAAYMGFRFNASVQRTTIALEFLSKGQFDAKTQMKEFLQIARDTAFLPQQVVDIGQSFIAFGFTAEETNRTLRATADAIAALNLPQDAIHRILFALGQIRVKGRVMGEELRQLANANIPAYEYLAQAFGKNVTQLNKIGDANIPAQAGIEAIVAGLERQYGGASERIRETTTGQFEILKGDLQAIMGGITFTAFEAAGGRLERITDVTGKMFKLALEGNLTFYDMVRILDDATGGVFHLVTAMESLHGWLKATWGSVKLVLSVLSPFIKITLIAVYILLEVTTAIQNFIHLGGRPLIIILQILVAMWILETLFKKISVAWTKRALFWDKLSTLWIGRKAKMLKLASIWNYLFATSTMTVWSAEKKQYTQLVKTGALLRLYTFITTAAAGATFLLSLAFWTSPVGLITASVIVLAGVLVFLELKFRAVTRAVEWLTQKWKELSDSITRSKLGFLFKGGGLIEMLGGPSTGGTSILDLIGGGGGTASFAGMGQRAIGMPAGGPAGPIMPVEGQPLDMAALTQGGTAPIKVTIVPQKIELDGREVAEVVWKHRLDRQARR